MENKVNTPPPSSFLLFSFFLSVLPPSLRSCSAVFFFFFYFTLYLSFVFSRFHSFHRSQSLDQVTLTNATILDGGGGGPDGSLAGSVGSVAVCLPSEPSLTDSLHTSAVSLPRDGSTHGEHEAALSDRSCDPGF